MSEREQLSRSDALQAAALDSKDLYCLLLDIQNGITAPGHAAMANSALLKIDAARKARRCIASETGAIKHPQTHDAAQARIAECVREIEMIADTFGYDPFEWLADKEET